MAIVIAIAEGCVAPIQTNLTARKRIPPVLVADFSAGLEVPRPMTQVSAWVDPPLGWAIDKLEVDPGHTHVVWLSPTRDTAYGVILINLPFPVGPDMVLWGFLNHLREVDQRADVIREQRAPELPGFRFVVDSGLYRIRVTMTVHGWHAWAVYAGTLLEKPIRGDQLLLAESARDRTRVDNLPETLTQK